MLNGSMSFLFWNVVWLSGFETITCDLQNSGHARHMLIGFLKTEQPITEGGTFLFARCHTWSLHGKKLICIDTCDTWYSESIQVL